MARNLTQWEKDQIKDIDNLIENCKLIYSEFRSECIRFILLKIGAANDLKESLRQKLRRLVIDLYSALDYLCYLCYCHFKNNGNPSDSPEARNVKFPYKNLKKSDVDGQEVNFRRQREKFVRDHFTTIFGPQDASTQERYDRFEEIILNCQVITNIGADGQPLQQQVQMEEAATCFNALHYLRNTNIHRNPVDIEVEDGWLYVDLDMNFEIVRERIPARENDPYWESFQVCSVCCIAIPSFMEGMENGKKPRPLLSVTENILDFVINTRNELLEIAFPHVDGLDGDILKFKSHIVYTKMNLIDQDMDSQIQACPVVLEAKLNELNPFFWGFCGALLGLLWHTFGASLAVTNI